MTRPLIFVTCWSEHIVGSSLKSSDCCLKAAGRFEVPPLPSSISRSSARQGCPQWDNEWEWNLVISVGLGPGAGTWNWDLGWDLGLGLSDYELTRLTTNDNTRNNKCKEKYSLTHCNCSQCLVGSRSSSSLAHIPELPNLINVCKRERSPSEVPHDDEPEDKNCKAEEKITLGKNYY